MATPLMKVRNYSSLYWTWWVHFQRQSALHVDRWPM